MCVCMPPFHREAKVIKRGLHFGRSEMRKHKTTQAKAIEREKGKQVGKAIKDKRRGDYFG